jgi:chemotaxis family two-component system response regulator Rcp1
VERGMNGEPVEILLVEDNPGDVVLVREALLEGRILNRIRVAEDGAKAIAILRGEGEHAGLPMPGLILLDLNLPGKGGFEVLAEIKGNERLKRIPVIVLTSSVAERDVVRAYDLQANCFVGKPIDFQQFLDVLRRTAGFWLTIVRLPRAADSRDEAA